MFDDDNVDDAAEEVGDELDTDPRLVVVVIGGGGVIGAVVFGVVSPTNTSLSPHPNLDPLLGSILGEEASTMTSAAGDEEEGLLLKLPPNRDPRLKAFFGMASAAVGCCEIGEDAEEQVLLALPPSPDPNSDPRRSAFIGETSAKLRDDPPMAMPLTLLPKKDPRRETFLGETS